jgi:hypothetical protein
MRLYCLTAVTASTLLAGCASFDGMQEPVIKADVAASLVTKSYGLETTLTRIQTERDKAAYRNRVMSIWLMAIDARYDTFRRDLSRGRKGSAVGLDILTLGLTATASVVGDAAEEFSAAATGVGGARASVDRELYFEKTLPVLITYMDAERLRERARMLQGMGRTIEEYSLEQGFADLWRYQSAGSLDRAIGKAAHEAGDDVAQAEYDYSLAVELCLPEDEASERRQALGARLLADLNAADATAKAAARANLLKAARLGAIQQADEGDIDKQQSAALSYLLGLCSPAELDGFETQVFGGAG